MSALTGELPALLVRNKVRWINEKLSSPFIFEMGSQSEFGLLLALTKRKPKNPARTLGVRTGHYRSADIGKFDVVDMAGNHYRDVDLKGSGLITGSPRGFFGSSGDVPLGSEQWRMRPERDLDGMGYYETTDVRGLMNLSDALHDANSAEKFTELGIRSHRALAIIELECLNVGGKMRKTEYFRHLSREGRYPHSQYLMSTFVPAIEVRAFGVKSRIEDLRSALRPDPFLATSMVDDARAMLESELGRVLTPKEYLLWFAETLGTGVGRMHAANLLHMWLNPQNITLDCRVVDLDDVYSFDKPTPDWVEDREDWMNQLRLKDVVSEYGTLNRPGGEESILDFAVLLQSAYPAVIFADEVQLRELYRGAYLKAFPEGQKVFDKLDELNAHREVLKKRLSEQDK